MKKLFSFYFSAVLFSTCACTSNNNYISFSGYAQGGIYTVKFNAKDVQVPVDKIHKCVDSLLELIDTTLSGYNKKSILSRLNAGEEVAVNKMFREMYGMAADFYEETEGALDCACGPLYDAWGFGFTRDELPEKQMVRRLQSEFGMKFLEKRITIPANGKLRASDLLLRPGKSPKLNFNTIAQGYSCDIVAQYIYSLGIKDRLVVIGEIFCDGVNANGEGWKIGVDRPFDGNNEPGKDLDGIWQSSGGPCSIVTSGNYRKFYVKDGRKYAHIIDPRSGYPVSHSLLSATIIADTGVKADAYATYCIVLGLEDAKKFIRSKEGIEGYLIYEDDGIMREWASEGFNLVNPTSAK